jgi:excisionase family DNA binding protein
MTTQPQNGPRTETYTPLEAGRILGVSDERIRQMVESGELAGEKHGGRWQVDQRAVHDLLHERGSPRPKTKKAKRTGDDAVQEARDLRARVEQLQRDLGRLEGRLELTAQTESTIREERDRLLQERDRERERAERERERAEALAEELKTSRRSWWSKLFGE